MEQVTTPEKCKNCCSKINGNKCQSCGRIVLTQIEEPDKLEESHTTRQLLTE